MAIINFAIPKTLEKRVTRTMKQKGFASKAEFFRFAAIYFMDIIDKPFADEDERFEYLADRVRDEIHMRYNNKKIPSLADQLKDV